jgi:hypothetical protein
MEEFECSPGLTETECLDLYTIVLYKDRLSKEELIERLRGDNKENMIFFLNIINSGFKGEPEYDSPFLENGEWNLDFGKKTSNIKGLLQDVKDLHREYA